MVKKAILYLLAVFVLLILLSALLVVKKTYFSSSAQEAQVSDLTATVEVTPEENKYVGERIVYNVYLGWAYLGRSEFRRLPDEDRDGGRVSVVTFETKIKGFYDLEKIYCEPENLLPLQIHRQISGWGMQERIIEDYNQRDFEIAFTKFKKNKQENWSAKADGPIQNAVLLPFSLREIPEPKVGWSMVARIPQKFEITLVAEDEIKTPAGKFRAYLFKSKPANFEIWVSADERRIPLKIKSSGSTMVMKEYHLE